MLNKVKQEQEVWKSLLGKEYQDYDLVVTLQNGRPVEERIIIKWFHELINKNGLPRVVFHSLRHTSTTYKLKLYGDIKSVQGDTGHAQAKMVTDVYARILDEDRKNNATIFEQNFYNTEAETVSQPIVNETTMPDADKLISLLQQSPELAVQLLHAIGQLTQTPIRQDETKLVDEH